MDSDLMLRATEASYRITRRSGCADGSMSRMFIRRAYSIERARAKRLRDQWHQLGRICDTHPDPRIRDELASILHSVGKADC